MKNPEPCFSLVILWRSIQRSVISWVAGNGGVLLCSFWVLLLWLFSLLSSPFQFRRSLRRCLEGSNLFDVFWCCFFILLMTDYPSEEDIDQFVNTLSERLSKVNFGSHFLTFVIISRFHLWFFYCIVSLIFFGYHAQFSLIPSLYPISFVLVFICSSWHYC